MSKDRFLILNRLRVMRDGKAVYDQFFHNGVNIIRGKNGSGKSTIADFIFFVLGGEFEDWKEAASLCDEVQAEIETSKGKITLKRSTQSKVSHLGVFFGSWEKAKDYALDGWQSFPLKRQSSNESFTQVLFRTLDIPEAKSDGASNITIHQLLRLCYADQRTPPGRLFRFEPFDTQNIREAVGDLVCGISGYEIYEASLRLRELDKTLSQVSNKLSGLLKALPPDEALRNTISINSVITNLDVERAELEKEIDEVDNNIKSDETKDYLKERAVAKDKVIKQREKLQEIEIKIKKVDYELAEIGEYQAYLLKLMEKLDFSEKSLNSIGGIDFVYCPACGSELSDEVDKAHCTLCKGEIDHDDEKSRYNQIRVDLELQLRESRQLLSQKNSQVADAKKEYRSLKSLHRSTLSDYKSKYAGDNGPREAYLAQRTSRIGHINAEIEFLTKSLDVAGEIDSLTKQKNEILSEINNLKDRQEALERQANKRRSVALTRVSENAVSLLKADFKRQEEFENASHVEINFENDSMSVDGKANFAESSNVFLKNTAILSIFLAAGTDPKFFHPRFLLMDNIEEKGMEQERSYLFQKLIVERATEIEVPYQVIFTTSMMNPELELDDYVIGPAYTREQKTLNIKGK
ncbi:MAG: AAA family ATPase [Candidatus Thiodiazotropha endolucinida]|nr:AAA family ATPase [Candidatus Thiodiazotropha taylori]MCW4262001.1 AAA family ATPase [Candidatus Thiodiazotropha endolucinida]